MTGGFVIVPIVGRSTSQDSCVLRRVDELPGLRWRKGLHSVTLPPSVPNSSRAAFWKSSDRGSIGTVTRLAGLETQTSTWLPVPICPADACGEPSGTTTARWPGWSY
jgi:hypothetical protein